LLVLLEEIKSQNQTQILLLDQLLNMRTIQAEEQQSSFSLPVTTLEQLKKLSSDDKIPMSKANWLVHFIIFNANDAFLCILICF